MTGYWRCLLGMIVILIGLGLCMEAWHTEFKAMQYDHKIGLIYSQATGRVRSTIIPDKGSDLVNAKLRDCEAMMTIPKPGYPNADGSYIPNPLQAVLNQQTVLNALGKVLDDSDRYVWVEQNNDVTAWGYRDPGCGEAVVDKPPGWLPSKTCQVGDKYNRGHNDCK